MSWETRERGGRYYTRSRRVNGKIEREYIGTGFLAEMASELDRLDREHREWERIERQLARSEAEASELRPALQVNIADKQVNVAGDVHTGAKEAAA
jgi:hypothetical protein